MARVGLTGCSAIAMYDGPDDIDRLLEDFPAPTPQEADELLRYFSALIEGMNAEELCTLRRRCAAVRPGSPEQETLLHVIDGEQVLRTLRDACG